MKVRIVASLLVLLWALPSYAANSIDSKSTDYQFTESVVGGGGLVQENSTHFKAGEAIGDTTVGSTSSNNFSFSNGFYTTASPNLAFAIDSSNANFGILSPAVAATATATFEVSNYTSYGYVVQVLGQPPANEGHVLPGLATTTPSQVGVEQFGLNVVANTSPTTFGANPNNGYSGIGTAAASYNTANNYRYVEGETIADAPKTSGLTIYTISYIINVATLTPGGTFSGQETLVCTGTY